MTIERWWLRMDLGPVAVRGPVERWFVVDAAGHVTTGVATPPPVTATAYVFQLERRRPLAAADDPGMFAAELEVPIAGGVLARLDRIRLAPASITPRHRHVGPGVRVLVEGRLDAMVGDRRRLVRAGEAWLERPEDDVIGRVVGPASATFLRLVLLPRSLAGGGSSFIPVAAAAGDPSGAPFEREHVVLAEAEL